VLFKLYIIGASVGKLKTFSKFVFKFKMPQERYIWLHTACHFNSYHKILSHYWTSPTTDSLLQGVQWQGFTWFCKIHANIRVVTLPLFFKFYHSTLFNVLRGQKKENNMKKPYFLPIYSLSLSSRDLFGKIIFTQLVQKLSHFYDTKKSLPRYSKGQSLVH
jgi:hypothetical protein